MRQGQAALQQRIVLPRLRDPSLICTIAWRRSGFSADDKAARRANRLITAGHTRRAAQTLHSTATLADLTQPAVREAWVQQLHPPLPADSVLPRLPADAEQVILEDGDEIKRIIRSSDNGSAAGPSGWTGRLLAALIESDLCWLGIVALLKDILNGNIPDAAKQHLLASRLVAITKPDSDSLRPIAVGELFYRLAAVIAGSRAGAAAAQLLAPHQHGVGVPSGAERIVHSMQHSLTDRTVRRAALKIDISNAFNSCDRAIMLRKLYATPELSSLYRIADLAYSAPSTLLPQHCDGASIESSNGVRQGDPLACLLFCLYMRELYAELAAEADVELYGFVDDLHIVGTPAEVVKALTALHHDLVRHGNQPAPSTRHAGKPWDLVSHGRPLRRPRPAMPSQQLRQVEEYMAQEGRVRTYPERVRAA